MKTFFLAMLLLSSGSVFAGQLSSDFQGRIVDATGQPVAGAVMVVKNLTTGRVSRHVSGKTGRWHAQGRRSDSEYRISCFAPGETHPQVRFQGRVLLGQVHTRNCVVGELDHNSPAWLSSWAWRQASGLPRPGIALGVAIDGSSGEEGGWMSGEHSSAYSGPALFGSPASPPRPGIAIGVKRPR